MQTKNTIFVSLILAGILVFSISSVSAFWPFSSNTITGNVINGEEIENTRLCFDSDGGVKTDTAGYVESRKLFRNLVNTGDACSGTRSYKYIDGKRTLVYSAIKESYCNEDQQVFETFTSEDLGEGYCISETVKDEAGRNVRSAKWMEESPSCTSVTNGVMDQNGKKYLNGCFDSENNAKRSGAGLAYKQFSCNEDGTINTEENICGSLCNPNGCAGVCSADTDSENLADQPGQLEFSGEIKRDTCRGNTVVQYACNSDNTLKTIAPVNCGVGKECTLDSLGNAYCREKIAGSETITSLSFEVSSLSDNLSEAKEKINLLINELCEKDSSYSFCS